MQTQTKLMIALDVDRAEEGEAVIESLRDFPVVYKVGLQLFHGAGPQWVSGITSQGTEVFLDLKYHDIPNTAGQAFKKAAELGVAYSTFHLSGGEKMARAVLKNSVDHHPLALGVSVLTSFERDQWISQNESFYHKGSGSFLAPEESAIQMIQAGWEWGVRGFVCSGTDLELIRKEHADLQEAQFVVPGIRFEGDSSDDQARVITPKKARELGAHAIVMGRSILGYEGAERPKRVEEALKDLSA